MKVSILASGSDGNCISIKSEETTILIDAGIAKTKIEKRLLEVGIRADEIDAIFITHAHRDHVKGLPLANKYHIPVYASEGEWKHIQGLDEELHCPLFPNECIVLPNKSKSEMTVDYFKTHHDAYDSLGYVIEGDQTISICLDTGKVDSEMLYAMQDSDIYIIEANHDPDMVRASSYPVSVQERILSDIGHLSNEQAATTLQRLIRGKGERIYLTHLSSANNLPTLARMTVIDALKRKGFELDKHYFLEVV